MLLTLQQIEKLVPLIMDDFSLSELTTIVDNEMGLDLNAIAPAGNYEKRIRDLIAAVQKTPPGRGDELLQALEKSTSKISTKNNLSKLQVVDYIGPSDDPHEAILLGRLAFVNRRSLRESIKEFSYPTSTTSRVIVVRGDSPSGKTHSWHLVQYLARKVSNARPVRVRLNRLPKGGPEDFMEAVRLVLGLSRDNWPPLTDLPQDSQIAKQLASWFMGELPNITQPVWLVIDDLNGTMPTKETVELVEDLAERIEESHPDNLWLIVIGLERDVTDGQYMLKDRANSPDRPEVHRYFESLAVAYGQTVPGEHLDRFVDEVFDTLAPPFSHDDLSKVNRRIERLSRVVQQQGGFPS